MSLVTEITKDAINDLPLWKFEGEITVLEKDSDWEEVIPKLWKADILGFDTEAKPAFKKGVYNPVSVIQLATADEVFVIRNLLCGFPGDLIRIFEDPSIIKVGAAIRDDLKDLQKLRKFEPQGFEDISTIAHGNNIKQIGAKNLTAIFLGKRISKAQQTSNWERTELSRAQLDYAATDAYLCLKVYEIFQGLKWV
ncbi:3'-5' exonuclease domain-containing protein 2 [Marivirga sp. S37H4]|uniref:3'-5' exonuclease domain-containing protein 2 n=1 Tax=Marivirga aurantiaca TaxID=2802615 RepID=A0A935C7B6_9BACT|nr:3'-5' exonuclease [Marivirga aurantiaca]MBK6264911.1 3'-5' exonuclease domain-containing protein 2 [Marivirga aurantiaca]